MTAIDALAALKVWGVEIELGGKTYHIPPVPAAGWFVAILRGEPMPIVPGMVLDEEQADLIEDMALGLVDLDDVVDAEREALEIASGWRWWAADRMIRSAAHEWKIVSGQLIRRGVDLSTLPLGAVLNALYAMATETLDQQKRIAFELELNRPPAGSMSEEERERQAEEMFMEALRAHQGGQPGQG